MIGSIVFGTLSEKWGGRRGAATLGMVAGILSTSVYLFSETSGGLMLGAWLIGFFASGAWGIVPGYLSERFPTEVRGVGTGFSYHVGVGIGAFAPYLIGVLQDGGTQLQTGDVLVHCRRRRWRDHAVVAGSGNEGAKPRVITIVP